MPTLVIEHEVEGSEELTAKINELTTKSAELLALIEEIKGMKINIKPVAT